jgi:hypothetical protein
MRKALETVNQQSVQTFMIAGDPDGVTKAEGVISFKTTSDI